MSWDASGEIAELENTGWDRRLRVFRLAGEVDVVAVIDRDVVTMVDTMPAPEYAAAILALLQPVLTGRQLLVVNTHADYDHAWGNAAFQMRDAMHRAPILASRQAAERLRSGHEQAYLAGRQREDARFAGVRLVPPTIELDGGGRIRGGQLSLELLSTPGHTADHLAVWIPEIRTLLAGDAAESPFPCCGEGSNLTALLASLRRLRALNAAVVIPCHGGVGTGELLSRNLAYFEEIASRVRACINAELLPVAPHSTSVDETVIGFSYEDALRSQGLDPHEVPTCYRQWHRLALQATVASLLAERG